MKTCFTQLSSFGFKRILTLSISYFIFTIAISAQSVGDLQSKTSATPLRWDSSGSWQICTVGGSPGPAVFVDDPSIPTSAIVARIANDGPVKVTNAGANCKNLIQLGNITVASGASLTASGTIFYVGTVDASLINNGTITTSGTITLTGTPAGTITNTGTFNANGAININAGGSLTNSGTFNSAGGVTGNTGSMIINNGTIAKTGGNFTINAGSVFTNNGSLQRNGIGAYNFNGTYQGTGSFEGTTSLTFTNGGIVSPGASPGCMTFAFPFTNTATLNIDINGATACTGFDALNITGNAIINGTINVIFGYTPIVGNKFKIVNASFGTMSGTPTLNVTPSTITAVYLPVTGEIEVLTAPLPVKLVNFDVRKSSRSALLTWVTASEQNNAYFDVEHSTNGLEFKAIGNVKGQGTTQSVSNYNFEHTAPFTGMNYYRLKQVDIDGAFVYSPVRSIEFGKSGFIIKSNLVKDDVDMIVNNSNAVEVSIYNWNGQKVLSSKVSGSQRISVRSLPSGMYIIRTADGETVRFVKQ